MSAASPRISVIVVCKNPGARLRTALESVWSQQNASAELIVIDGASIDGTSAWLDSQRTRIATFVSEPDAGIYDAMNKGIARARGEWVLFLGADDRLSSPDVLARASSVLDQSNAAVVTGEARFDDGRRYAFSGEHAAIRRNFVHHQATFYRRELFQHHGGFHPAFRIQADYEFNLRLLKRGAQFTALPLHIANCARGGVSDSGLWANYREEIRARRQHLPASQCLLWDALSVVRCLRKKLLLLRRHA